MWKVVTILLIFQGLAMAQSSAVPAEAKNANPLEGVTFWPKVRASSTPSFGFAPRFRVSSFPDTFTAATKTFTVDAIGKPTLRRFVSGSCAIPLMQLTPPANRTFSLKKLLPTFTDEEFVAKPAVPSC